MGYDELKPEKGKILISAPHLTDFFHRSVVFMVEHTEDGSIGFVVNKPVKLKVNEIIEDFPEFNAPVLLGGPVQTDLINFIHKAGNIIEGTYEIQDGIFWGGNYESLKALVSSKAVNPEDFLFMLGYAGWSPNQLNGELANNAWFLTHSSKDIIFTDKKETLWQDILKKMGGEFAVISSFPEDPSVN